MASVEKETPTQPSPTPGVEELTNALISSYYSPLKMLSTHLEELEASQLEWLSKLSKERDHQSQISAELKEVQAIFLQVPQYIEKIKQMKKDMNQLRHQVQKMLATANKIAEKKRKEELAQQEKDRQLMARPSKALLEEKRQQEASGR